MGRSWRPVGLHLPMYSFNRTRASIAAAILALIFIYTRATAQVVTDDFTHPGQWTPVMAAGDGGLQVTGGAMQYTATAVTDSFALQSANTLALSYASDWTLQVTAHIAGLALPFQTNFADLELVLSPAGGDFTNRVMYQFEFGNWIGGVTRSVYVDAVVNDVGGKNLTLASEQVGLGGADTGLTVSLRLSYSAALEEITFSFDRDGVANPTFGWEMQGTDGRLAIGSGSADLGMTAGDMFTVSLVGASEGILIAAGEATFTNLTVGAVPEPATAAVLSGLGVLGLAFWRRWRHAAVSPR